MSQLFTRLGGNVVITWCMCGISEPRVTEALNDLGQLSVRGRGEMYDHICGQKVGQAGPTSPVPYPAAQIRRAGCTAPCRCDQLITSWLWQTYLPLIFLKSWLIIDLSRSNSERSKANDCTLRATLINL